MNQWLMGTLAALVLLVPASLLTTVGGSLDRLVAMQLTSTIAVFALLLFAEGANRDVYFDLAVVLEFLSFVGTLFYLRFLESWL